MDETSLYSLLYTARQRRAYDLFLGIIPPGRAGFKINGLNMLHIFLKADLTSYTENSKPWDEDVTSRKRGVDHLLSNGAEVNSLCDFKEWSPLIYSVEREDVIVVEHLLKRGADMRYAPPGKLNSIQLARSRGIRYAGSPGKGLLSIAKVFMMHGAKPSEFTVKQKGRKPTLYATQEMIDFYAKISATRVALVALIGSRQKSPILRIIGKDIVRYLAQIVYQTRDQDCWVLEIERPKKRHAP